MGPFGMDGQDAATTTALITGAGWLAFNCSFIAYLTVVWPAQILADRRHEPTKETHKWLRTGLLVWLAVGLGFCGWSYGSSAPTTNLLTTLIFVVTLVSPMIAGAVAVRSTTRWRRWLKAEPAGQALSPTAQTALSTRLGTYDYWRTGWWLGVPAIGALGVALTPHFGMGVLALMFGVVFAWLAIGVLARRVAVQLDPLSAFVRTYRAHTSEIESARSQTSFTLSRDPWSLAHGQRIDIEKQLLEVAALRLARQIRRLPATLHEGCRNGCGQLLLDVAGAPTNGTMLRGLFIASVTGPFPYADTTPERELGSATRDWRTFAWVAAIGAALSFVTTTLGAVRAIA